MIKTYKQAKEYLTDFYGVKLKRKPTPGSSYLKRMVQLMKLLGNPQNSFSTVHIAGTSGKGSTSLLISKILRYAGYKTGLTISPHLLSYRERLQINNKNISKYKFIKILNKIKPVLDNFNSKKYGQIRFMLLAQAMSFIYFAQERVDIAVVETGAGGRYDGTNVTKSIISVITPIDYDHTSMLGKTLKQIAYNKAGIIKKNHIAAVSAKQRSSAGEEVRKTAKELKVKLYEENKDFYIKIKKLTNRGVLFDFFSPDKNIANIFCSLVGPHQAHNAALAIKTILELKNIGFVIKISHIKKALSDSVYYGRFEIRRVNGKIVILDGAHNQHKFTALLNTLSALYPKDKFICVFSCKKTKEVQKSVEVLNTKTKTVIVTKFKHLGSDEQQGPSETQVIIKKLKKIKFKGETYEIPILRKALFYALKNAKKNDKVLITGSLHTVADASRLLFNKKFIKNLRKNEKTGPRN